MNTIVEMAVIFLKFKPRTKSLLEPPNRSGDTVYFSTTSTIANNDVFVVQKKEFVYGIHELSGPTAALDKSSMNLI